MYCIHYSHILYALYVFKLLYIVVMSYLSNIISKESRQHIHVLCVYVDLKLLSSIFMLLTL